MSSLANASSIVSSAMEIVKLLAKLAEEYDRHNRHANVYLFSKPENGLKSKQSQALVFEFEDGSVRTIEGSNHEGKLEAMYSKESPKNPPESSYKLLGEVNTSPEDVRNLAVSNKLNGIDYSLTGNNSEQWILEIVATLGGMILKNMGIIDSIDIVKPLFAYGLAASTASSRSLRWPSSFSSS